MQGRGEPRHQPIAMLPTIAHLIDEGLADTSEQYAPMLEARSKPWVLDDALINRSKRVNGEALEWCGVYDRQLTRWLSRPLRSIGTKSHDKDRGAGDPGVVSGAPRA